MTEVVHGIERIGKRSPESDRVLTPQALEFLAKLHRTFEPTRARLLERRRTRQREINEGARPSFLDSTQTIREGTWRVAPVPDDLRDRRVEITGPVDRKMMIHALNSGASVYMADFEDSLSPTWENVIHGQANCMDAIRRRITFAGEGGKELKLKEGRLPTLCVRPRGWHLQEGHIRVDDQPISASLFDFGLYFFHNARELLERGTGPYFYLPKMESHLEARLWAEVFAFAEHELGIASGSVRATVLIETVLAAFEMDEILYELRDYSSGLNAGRWDYIFSFLKKFQARREFSLPDRSMVTMTVPFMRSYCRLLVQTCKRRGAQAIGGMSAFVPSRKAGNDVNERAFQQVREDKLREATDGFDGTWVAHPDLVPVAREVFDQAEPRALSENIGDLIDVAISGAKVTEAGIRGNVSVSLQYLESWLSGTGAVTINHLMEDAATAEIARAQLWHWVRHGVKLETGKTVSAEFVRSIIQEESAHLANGARITEAREVLEGLVFADDFPDFLTVFAMEYLEKGLTVSPIRRRPLRRDVTWQEDPRWCGIKRAYSAETVLKLRPSVRIEHTLATLGARKLWDALSSGECMRSLGALNGSQAVQMVKAGLKSIYVSGWQVAADANLAGQTYPDQSLYPNNSVPALVRRINQALIRADEICGSEGDRSRDWLVPIVADGEAGFGGPIHSFELTKALIEAGAAAVHFEDQLASEKKCGHMGGKVLVPTSQFIRTLHAARLAGDVLDVPIVVIARTDARGATLLTSDIDPRDRPFIESGRNGERTAEGYFRLRSGIDSAIARALAYAPYADVLWFETGEPDLAEAARFAEAVHAVHPRKPMAYNCSPSFHWKARLNDDELADFQQRLAQMGYLYQFVTLAGWHSVNVGAFELSADYLREGMPAYVRLQEREFALGRYGYTATRHQREVGTSYFDEVLMAVSEGHASTAAWQGSTEAAQFSSGISARRERVARA